MSIDITPQVCWIRIADRKPTKGQKVLISNGDIVTVAIVDYIINSHTGETEMYFRGCGFDGYEWDFDFYPSEATHWTPLPDAPKEHP